MKNNIIIKDYKPLLNLIDTEITIKLVKDTFERKLAEELGLIRVSAPLFVEPQTGLNDNLTGVEKAVSFKSMELGYELEVVQSLAKWKRNALKMYNFAPNTGLYTDMNAIRPFEVLDNIHSLYVDQWDWEKIITKEDRNIDFLKETVNKIYNALLKTEEVLVNAYPILNHNLPKEIRFISTSELEQLYPYYTRKERENAIAKEYKAVFLYQIGWPLQDGASHDGRAADYDDWNLNGDILLWYEPLQIAFEISSMGIRVDKESIMKQLQAKNEMFKINNPYVQNIINDVLPLTIGGGIGQSRMCMYMLKKAHIGEVQSSVWSKEDIELFKNNNINLL